jgi:hypothetical protein
MRRLLTCIIFVFIIACSTRSEVVKDTDYLKYGTRASVIEKVWGKPDETMAFQDYQAQSNYSFWGASGSWNRYGGSASGGGFSGTYTPSTIVWIYRERGYSLFFAQKGVFNEDPNPINIKIWKLVGWQNLSSDQTTKPQVSTPQIPKTSTSITPSMSAEKIVTVIWTFANIRSGAGDNHPVVITVKQGDKLVVIGESGEWFNVRLENGQEGWISNGVVK